MFFFRKGFISNVYKVTFKSTHANEHQHPCEWLERPESIVIKFYDKGDQVPYDVFASQVNSLMLSVAHHNQLAPKVYYVCEEAVVYKFYSCRDANEKDDACTEFLQEVASKLAKFHSLDIPIAKNNMIEKLKSLKDWMLSAAAGVDDKDGNIHKRLVRFGAVDILNGNFREQVEFVFERILASSGPIVFSHCDFNHTNILMVKDKPDEAKERVCFIDFDFSGYHFRGRDIGKFFSNCDQEHIFSGGDVIGDEKMLQFIDYYIEENDRLYNNEYSKQSENDPGLIMKEAKLFVLMSYLIDVTFCMWYTNMVGEEKHEEFIGDGNRRFVGFLRAKERFLEDKSI